MMAADRTERSKGLDKAKVGKKDSPAQRPKATQKSSKRPAKQAGKEGGSEAHLLHTKCKIFRLTLTSKQVNYQELKVKI